MWLSCATQEEIAEATDVPRKTIDDWTGDFGEKLAADNSPFPSDFDPPIYNVWKQQTKTAGVNHFGNSEVRCQGCPAKGAQRKTFLLPW